VLKGEEGKDGGLRSSTAKAKRERERRREERVRERESKRSADNLAVE
jgi:hypothetical protein